MLRKNFYFIQGLLILLFFSQSMWSQSAPDTENYFDQYLRYLSNGQDGAAYSSLYRCFEENVKVLLDASQTANHNQTKSVLKRVYQGLHDGAFFYTGKNDQTHALQFAQAYIDLSIMPAMQSEGLPHGANYAQLARFAAAGTWNKREHAKAIPYLYTYLTTGDLNGREEVFAYIGQAYYEQKDYANVKQFLSEGLRQYPSNLLMLSTIINTFQDLGDMDGMQPYLKKALALRPTDEGLLNLQGQIYERQGLYEQAIECYRTIQQSKPQSLDVARHLAQDYYNAGVQEWMQGKKGKRQAETHFRNAEPLLKSIMASDPLAVKYAFALANVYSLLDETSKLQDINNKLASLGIQPLDKNVAPSLMDMNDSKALPALTQNNVAQNISQPATVSASPVTPSPIVQSPVAPSSVAPSSVAPSSVNSQPKATSIENNISDVDVNIPVNKTDNKMTFAVIIANENYDEAGKNVPMALNDGRIFAEYCNKVLGLPKTNIRMYENTTSLKLEDALIDIKGIAEACKGRSFDVLFYYAGHGVPDVATHSAYLMPVDATGRHTRGCLSLDRLYETLGTLGAQSVCVFLDACFSGAARGGGMIASARGVEIETEPMEVQGNMVVFSATSEKQTALPYEEQKHGLFTYFLLKKLQETKGNVTLGQLSEFLEREVALQSQLVNRKAQNPTVISNRELGDKWKRMKLIKK